MHSLLAGAGEGHNVCGALSQGSEPQTRKPGSLPSLGQGRQPSQEIYTAFPPKCWALQSRRTDTSWRGGRSSLIRQVTQGETVGVGGGGGREHLFCGDTCTSCAPIRKPCFSSSLDCMEGQGAGQGLGSQVFWSPWGASSGLPSSFVSGPSSHRD